MFIDVSDELLILWSIVAQVMKYALKDLRGSVSPRRLSSQSGLFVCVLHLPLSLHFLPFSFIRSFEARDQARTRPGEHIKLYFSSYIFCHSLRF